MSEPRATGSLYTGIHSRSFQHQQQLRQEQAESKATKLAEFAPDAGLVFDEIAKLRTEVAAEIVNLITVDMDKTDVKSVVVGLRLADQKLQSLNSRLKNILRVPKVELPDEDL